MCSLRSNLVKKGSTRAAHRSLFYALGFTEEDMKKPMIAVVNAQSEVIAGHAHLDDQAKYVKYGILAAGGVPVEVPAIGICDGIAMGHEGMKYPLASRELIADSVEALINGHAFDGMVMIPNCDKIVPGMLMAALRVNIPTVFCSGGPMLPGRYEGRDISISQAFEAAGRFEAGKIDKAELTCIEKAACPGCGSCAGLFTANTMNCLTEVLGMGLPGNGTIPAAFQGDRARLAKKAGEAVVRLVQEQVLPRDIMTLNAFKNAITVDMAIGGSTNTALHLPAIAHELGISIDGDTFDGPTDELVKNAEALSDGERRTLTELIFAYGRYLQIASSRDGAVPTGLQGLWCNRNDPPWHADIHANINVQMNYWPSETTNLAETALPLLNYVYTGAIVLPYWRQYARDYTGNAAGWLCFWEIMWFPWLFSR